MIFDRFPLTTLSGSTSSRSIIHAHQLLLLCALSYTMEPGGESSDDPTPSKGQCTSTAAIATQQAAHHIYSFQSFLHNGMTPLAIGLA